HSHLSPYTTLFRSCSRRFTVKAAVLSQLRVELVVLDADRPADSSFGVRFGKAEGSPVPKLVLVVGPEVHLAGIRVGIEFVKFLVVVALPVDKRHKAASRFGTKNFTEELRFQIVFDSVPCRVLAVLQ